MTELSGLEFTPTKPQSQSSIGFAKSYRTNTNTALTKTANIVKILHSVLSQSCWEGIALRKTFPPFVLQSMTEWSGPEFTSDKSLASNQATKTTMCGRLQQSCKTNTNSKLLPSPHTMTKSNEKPTFSFVRNTTMTNPTYIVKISHSVLSQSRWEGIALRKMFPPFVLLSMTEWSGPEFTYRGNAASNQATKPM